MEKKDKYFECIFTDNKREDFDKLCTKIDEFGSNKDMLSFKAKSITSDKFVLLQIIPKSQIKQIINHYTESDIREIFEES